MELIREGNRLFNEGKIEEAKNCFLKANYTGGLLRVADYLFYDMKRPLNALPLYMKCNSKEKVDEIYQRMAFALGKLIKDDKNSNNKPDIEVDEPKKTSIIPDIISRDLKSNN